MGQQCLKKHEGEAWCNGCIDAHIAFTSQTTTKNIDQIPGYRRFRPGKCFCCGKTLHTAVYEEACNPR